MTCLYKNEYFTVLFHAVDLVVEVVRSAVAFPSPQQVAPAFTQMLLLLDDLGRHRYALLLDSRDAVPNNDPSYEASYARFREDLHRGFRRVAVLVRTPAGNLQASRLAPRTDAPLRVFLEREAAWEFVAEKPESRKSLRVMHSQAPPRSRRPSFDPE